MERRLSKWVRYLAAIAVSVVATVITMALSPAGEIPPYTIHFGAVLVSSWFGGPGPGLLTMGCSMVLVHGLQHPHPWMELSSHELLRLSAFSLLSFTTLSMTSMMKRAARRAEEGGAAVRVTLSSIPDGVIVTDPRGSITLMNPPAQTLTAWRQEDALGRPIEEVVVLLDEDTRTRVENPVRLVLREGLRTSEVHARTLRDKDGHERPVEGSAASIYDDKGLLLGSVVVFRDISKTRQIGEDLQRSEADLSDFFENAPVGVHWVGPDGIILRANRAELLLLGYEREEYVGHHISEYHVDQTLIEGMLSDLSAGRTLHNVEASLRCKDGSLRHVRITSNALRRKGAFIHSRGFTRDITAQKRAEGERLKALEQAEASNRAKDRFIATLSHELRTPLTPVLLAVVDLLEQSELRPELRGRLEMIRRNVGLEVRLIDDLLDMTRIVKGKVVLDFEPSDVHVLIERVLEICKGELQSKSIDFHARLEASRPWVLGDSARLQQVFWNLVKNAVKYTPAHGRILVTSSDGPNGYLVVAVTDSGVGFEPAVVPRIFLPFEQASTGEESSGGLGLGLAISSVLVEAHGGKIRGSSPGVGQGASFLVELPAVESAELANATVPRRETLPFREPASLTILVVEDHADTARMMFQILTKRNHRVFSAANVRSALEQFREHPIDLLISDLSLPDGDGLDLVRQLLALRPVKAIALSGHGTDADLAKSRAAGFDRHLTKPVELGHLLQTIQELTETSQSE